MARVIDENIQVDLNPEFQEAVDFVVNTRECLFITGNAGTGKSTLLNFIYSSMEASGLKNCAIVAPTGMAAMNVGGVTIHSLFRFPHKVLTAEDFRMPPFAICEVMRALDMLIVDEVSMVRADLLDGMDMVLRAVRKNKLPFGGVQMIFFGDLFQLPPVVVTAEQKFFSSIYKTPYFFSAKCMKNVALNVIELKKIYRQSNEKFIEILNKVRNDQCKQADLDQINTRLGAVKDPKKNYVVMTCTNLMADTINMEKLAALKTEQHEYEAWVSGLFDEKTFPTERVLKLKEGAQVMFVRNDREHRWVNGTIGVVESLKPGCIRVRVGAEIFDVTRVKWEKYSYEKRGTKILATPVGEFTQYPLKLAWAITIHKSQGQTFKDVVIDLGTGAFAHGQLYVALSRCTSLEGIVLNRPVKSTDLIFDERVYQFSRALEDKGK